MTLVPGVRCVGPKWFIFAGLSSAIVLACSQVAAIWIIPGSDAQHLAFGLATKRGGDKAYQTVVFQVDSCANRGGGPKGALWRLELQDFEPPYPTSIRYGVVPSKFKEVVPAAALGPGCYRASAANARVAFDIAPDGTVTERDSVPAMS
jgi:hypothetical protein